MSYRNSPEERRNREACIRSTIEQNPHYRSDLSPREIDRAVERGMTISDSGGGQQTWGDIARAAVAVVKDDRGRR